MLHKFRFVKNGYNPSEVDSLIKKMEEELEEYKNKKSSIERGKETARLEAERTIEEAEKEAGRVLEKARISAANIRNEAKTKAKSYKGGFGRLRSF